VWHCVTSVPGAGDSRRAVSAADDAAMPGLGLRVKDLGSRV
jgi:hypothetical protein